MGSRVAASVAVALLIGVTPQYANAGVSDLQGQITFVPRPNSSTLSGFRSDTAAKLYAERADYIVPDFSSIDPTIPSELRLSAEISEPGLYSLSTGLARQFQPGETFNSYIVAFGTGNPASAFGSVSFDLPILGIMTSFGSKPRLEAVFETGIPGLANENSGTGTGLEFNTGGSGVDDSIQLSADRFKITFTFNVNGFSDNIRIFTAVPEPVSFALLGAGLIGLTAARRKRAYLRV